MMSALTNAMSVLSNVERGEKATSSKIAQVNKAFFINYYNSEGFLAQLLTALYAMFVNVISQNEHSSPSKPTYTKNFCKF